MDQDEPKAEVPKGMLSVPDEILKPLVEYCKGAGLGLAHMGKKDMCIFLIADSELHPNRAAVDGAHMLLEGVVNGKIAGNNQANNAILDLDAMQIPDDYKPS